VTGFEIWLQSTWAYVRGQLPPAPARVLEIGCGPRGGLVPLMLEAGYDAVGVDPEAPAGPGYHRVEFERFETTAMNAIVACTSLHHVADLGVVMPKAREGLTPGGVLVVVEWDWESMDEATARWCFERLREPTGTEADHSWLLNVRDEWLASGQPWMRYLATWAAHEGLHTAGAMLREMDQRFDRRSCVRSPYYFPDLADTTESDEQDAIDAHEIQAGGIRFVGRPGAH
jgi:SAM-dependent methyltransferase